MINEVLKKKTEHYQNLLQVHSKIKEQQEECEAEILRTQGAIVAISEILKAEMAQPEEETQEDVPSPDSQA